MYDDETFIANPWPTWVEEVGGVRARHWIFEFVSPLPTDGLVSADLDQPDLAVEASRGQTPHELRLVARTRANAWSDEVFFFQFFALFHRLEQAFGPLRSIQGQARELWRPFR